MFHFAPGDSKWMITTLAERILKEIKITSSTSFSSSLLTPPASVQYSQVNQVQEINNIENVVAIIDQMSDSDRQQLNRHREHKPLILK